MSGIEMARQPVGGGANIQLGDNLGAGGQQM